MLWRKLHFELIARTIRTFGYPSERERIAKEFAVALAPTNPKFNRERFINAATGREETRDDG